MRRAWCGLVGTVLAVAGCGDDGGAAGPDGGSGDGDAGYAGYVVDPPVSPAAPAPPVIAPCPPGWREVAAASGPTICDPWPEGGPAACAAPDEAHFPGEPGCRRLGPACGGEWAPDLPGDRPILYVRPGALGGDGSPESPHGTIAAAMAVAPVGAVVALAQGTYDEIVALKGGVALWGACVAGTTVASQTPGMGGTIAVLGAGAEVRNLRLGGRRPGLLASGGGRQVTLHAVVVDQATAAGLLVLSGASLTGTDVVVRDTRPEEAQGWFGTALDVEAGASATLDRAVLARSRDLGVYVSASMVSLANVAVREGLGQASDGDLGWGVQAVGGATVTIAASAIEGNRGAAISAFEPGTRVTIDRSVVRATAPQAGGRFGRGVGVQDGAAAVVVRTLVADQAELAFFAGTPGATMDLGDVVARGCRKGFEIGWGASVRAERVWFETLADAGIHVDGLTTSLTLADAVIADAGQPLLVAQAGGRLVAARVRVERGRSVGVLLSGDGSSARIEDLVVGGVMAPNVTGFGHGIHVQRGADLEVVRAVVERNTEVGVEVAGAGSSAILADVVVRETQSRPGGTHGQGVEAQEGAIVTLERARLERNRTASLAAWHAGTRITATDVVILDTAEAACAAAQSCGLEAPGGLGALALQGANISLAEFELRGSAFCGLQLAAGGTIDLRDGAVVDNPIGANVLTAGFDLARLMPGVRWDNLVNLDTTAQPVPTAPGTSSTP